MDGSNLQPFVEACGMDTTSSGHFMEIWQTAWKAWLDHNRNSSIPLAFTKYGNPRIIKYDKLDAEADELYEKWTNRRQWAWIFENWIKALTNSPEEFELVIKLLSDAKRFTNDMNFLHPNMPDQQLASQVINHMKRLQNNHLF